MNNVHENNAPLKDAASLFDRVASAVSEQPKETCAVSRFNSLKVHDTPSLWGIPFASVRRSEKLSSGAESLASAIKELIGGGRKLIDIVSLGVPEGQFKDVITEALKEAILATNGNIVIRFLFGYVPIFGEVLQYREYLLENVIHPLGNTPVPAVYFTQLSSLSLKNPQWNHCKIIAADGSRAISGGHNLWWTQYATYPPAHDLSIEVKGQAALDAQYFIEYLWTTEAAAAGAELDRYRTLSRNTTCAEARWQTKPAYGGKAISGIDELKAPKEPFGSRMMAIGRSYMNPAKSASSDIAKFTIISGARRSLNISQQDLVFSHFTYSQHLVCKAIADALLKNSELVVRIVVSPKHGWAGPQFYTSGGASYSWGAGVTGTLQRVVDFINELEADSEKRYVACKRLFVAPMCFTTASFDSELDYNWPWLGRIAEPYPWGFNTYPSPANHAKFYMADDQICYIGSDNLYPNSNPEFGYLIENGDGNFEKLKTLYWDQLWQYSKEHAITTNGVDPWAGSVWSVYAMDRNGKLQPDIPTKWNLSEVYLNTGTSVGGYMAIDGTADRLNCSVIELASGITNDFIIQFVTRDRFVTLRNDGLFAFGIRVQQFSSNSSDLAESSLPFNNSSLATSFKENNMVFNPAGTVWDVWEMDNMGKLKTEAPSPIPWEFGTATLRAADAWYAGYRPLPDSSSGILVEGIGFGLYEIYFLTNDRFISICNGKIWRFGVLRTS